MLDRLASGMTWEQYLASPPQADDVDAQLRRHESTGRPLGGDQLLEDLEALLGRQLKLKKAGRPRKKPPPVEPPPQQSAPDDDIMFF